MKQIVRGFSLVELLIVVVVIGLVATVAFPIYQNSLISSRRARAQIVLESIAAGMERYYVAADTYVGAAASDVPTNAVYNLTDEDMADYYDFTATGLTATAFSLFATPVDGASQDADGALTITSSGVRAWDENNDSDDGYESSW